MDPLQNKSPINAFYDNLPAEVEKLYNGICERVSKFNTFDLIANISYYNHMHSVEEYTDIREDRHFFVPEALSLLCLKSDFVKETTVPFDDFLPEVNSLQKDILSYCTKKTMLGHQSKGRNNPITAISNLLINEAIMIRNPGLPDHHLVFAEKLFSKYEKEIKNICGFTIKDSVTLRKQLPLLLNHKFESAREVALNTANLHTDEVISFRSDNVRKNDSNFTFNELKDYSLLSEKKLRSRLQNHFFTELFYSFSNVYCFSAIELSEYTKIDLDNVLAFLELLACNFPSIDKDAEIYEPITILKSKPLLKHEDKYLVASIPLLNWAVEEVVEEKIKKQPKFQEKYISIKHDFLIEQGLLYFKTLLPTAIFHPVNLFYSINEDRYETDCLISYDRVLFIVEAKGNRISQKAKAGHELKTKDHLEDIIRDSYAQAIRTLEFIESSSQVEFKDKKGKRIQIKRCDYDEIVIVPLILEPIGNLTMAIKTTDELGYFKKAHFPWIISLYDLVIIADLIENPFLFMHYIRRRKKFLSHTNLHIHEEIDLLAYFLFNGLDVDSAIEKAGTLNDYIQFAPNTDEINDYYMFEFGHKEKFTEKPKSELPDDFKTFLSKLDASGAKYRVKMASVLMEFSYKSIEDLMKLIKKIKISFSADKKLHDASLYTEGLGGFGITYMTSTNREELDSTLRNYCDYKIQQLNCNGWIGIGDISIHDNYNFRAFYFKMKNPELDKL